VLNLNASSIVKQTKQIHNTTKRTNSTTMRMKKFMCCFMQILVLMWLTTWVNASTEKKYFELFPKHIMYLTMDFLDIDDCFKLIVKSKTLYTTYHPIILDVINWRHHKELTSPETMNPIIGYRNLAFLQAVIRQELLNELMKTPITRDGFFDTTILMLFNGADPYPKIKRSDLTERAQISKYFRENKNFFDYVYVFLPNQFFFCFDAMNMLNGSMLPMVYDPFFANLWIYEKSFDDPTNVAMMMKLHIPAVLHFVDKFGQNIFVEQISTCKCTDFSAGQDKSWAKMEFQSINSKNTYRMVFDTNGFLETIKIFQNQFRYFYEFVQKNEYHFDDSKTTNPLNCFTVYTSYYPVASESLYLSFKNDSK